MKAYIIRRFLLLIPTILILTTLVFFSVRFIPGNVVDQMLSKMGIRGADYDREALVRILGLDVPAHVQYGRWMGVLPTPERLTGETQFKGVLQGTLGNSLQGNWRVEEEILLRLPVTIELGAMAIVIGLLIALPVGIYSALRQDTAADYAGRTAAVIGLSTPNFWLAIMVMLYPALWWGWSPPLVWVPFNEDPLGNLGVLIVPSLILGTASAASTMRLTRTMMLEVLRQDYIRTAWSKGLKERVVVTRHALKNALIPVVTLIGMELPTLVGGALIIELIFNLPGMGRLFLTALEARDYPVVSGVNLFFCTIVMLSILVTDLVYPFLDPRVRYS
ncbi:ABC transporter permease [Dehalococcoidia bacterium]|nr:ABC transporter permease [Dehalococcoidia bacterium]